MATSGRRDICNDLSVVSGLVVGRASYGGVYCGGGASIGHLRHDYEAGYTGPQELQRCNKVLSLSRESEWRIDAGNPTHRLEPSRPL